MTTVAATMSIMNAIVTPTSHDLERRTKKPVSAAISSAVAINSAIRPYPCDVIMGSYYANGDGFDPSPLKWPCFGNGAEALRKSVMDVNSRKCFCDF